VGKGGEVNWGKGEGREKVNWECVVFVLRLLCVLCCVWWGNRGFLCDWGVSLRQRRRRKRETESRVGEAGSDRGVVSVCVLCVCVVRVVCVCWRVLCGVLESECWCMCCGSVKP